MNGWEQEIDKKMTLDALVALISRIYTRKIMLDVNPQPRIQNLYHTRNVLHSKLETRNQKPETRNPEPATRNPKPETRKHT